MHQIVAPLENQQPVYPGRVCREVSEVCVRQRAEIIPEVCPGPGRRDNDKVSDKLAKTVESPAGTAHEKRYEGIN